MKKDCRYELMRGSKKELCPQCDGGSHKEKSFKRYVDTTTGEILPIPSGRCDRINNCGYHSNPYKNGEAGRIFQEAKSQNFPYMTHQSKAVSSFPVYREKKQETPQYDTVPRNLYFQSGEPGRYDTNVFIGYLREYFGRERTDMLIREYCIGNSHKDTCASIFWQVSYNGEVRTGKKITYNLIADPSMHLRRDIKRVKTIHPYLVHKDVKRDFKVYPCFFGEHLLKRYPEKPVLMVEAEKTAIIASVFYPDFVCIAAGGSAGCRWSSEYYAMKPLIGRNVIMYPDLKNTEAWEKKAAYLRENGVKVMVSKKLIDWATPKDFENDNDLADYLLRYDPAEPVSTKSIKLMQHKSEIMEHVNTKANAQNTIRAYIDEEGKLYIETPLSDTYTIRESIEHYNKRSGSITFIKKSEMDITHFKTVFIDGNTLAINFN
jgi:hypothetical protein